MIGPTLPSRIPVAKGATRDTAARLTLVIVLATLTSSALAAGEQVEVAKIQAATWSYVVFAVTVTTVKIVALTLGYFIAKLGYSTMMAGVQGKDSVELGAFGAKFKFKGVTPGLAFGIVGILMMGWALSTKHQFSAEVSKIVTEGHENENSKHVPPEI